jgi:hypothetical protein
MNWSDLALIAAEAGDDGGIMVTAPIVVGPDGVVRRVADVMDNVPRLSSPIASDEFQSAIRSGMWKEIPSRKAIRGFVTIVLGPALARALERAEGVRGLSWTTLSFGWYYAYADSVAAGNWQAHAIEQLLGWANDAFSRYIATGIKSRDMEIIEGAAHLAISLTAEASAQRLATYVLLGAILSQVDPTGQAVLQEFAVQEFGMTAQEFDTAVEERLERALTLAPSPVGDHTHRPALYGAPAIRASHLPVGELVGAP